MDAPARPMSFRAFVDDLELLVRSRYALIFIDTWELDRADEAARHVASTLSLRYHDWRRSKGLRFGGEANAPLVDDTALPVDALRHVEREAGVFHFPLLGDYLQDPQVVSHLLDVVERFGVRRGAVIVSGGDVRIPDALRPHAIVVRLPAPEVGDYRQLVERVTRDHAARMPVRVELAPEERARLLHNLLGLTLAEAERIVTRLIMSDGALTAADIARVAVAKRQAVEQDGLLEYWATSDGLSSVAGLDGLKAWLGRRRAVIADPDGAARFGLPFPRGILLTGVPGCGKSLCAKAVAHEWGLPLLRLDPGLLFDKYVGDSEKNFKRALRTAERMAPIVLWIDELEKVFAGNGASQDGGVSQRVFGGFLSWLQERRGDVFVVATSNDVSTLPPEFVRKGRFDEVFFVDLPDTAARARVFELHVQKRAPTARVDLAALAAASEGFSGAEIEQAVVSALFAAFADAQALTTSHVLAELRATHPLSRTMAERLDALRTWARDRTVDAAGTGG